MMVRSGECEKVDGVKSLGLGLAQECCVCGVAFGVGKPASAVLQHNVMT